MPNPAQSCGNCFFMKPQIHTVAGDPTSIPCCRFEVPLPTDSLQSTPARWAPVDPVNDWCGHWSSTGAIMTGPTGPPGSPGVNAPQWNHGTAVPTAGNDGDWYIQTGILGGSMAIFQKTAGIWVHIAGWTVL